MNEIWLNEIPTLNEHLSPRAEARLEARAQGRRVSEAHRVLGSLGIISASRVALSSHKGEAGTARLSSRRPGQGPQAFSGSRQTLGRTQGSCGAEANLTPRQRPSRGPGKEGRGWAGRGQGPTAHTHVYC